MLETNENLPQLYRFCFLIAGDSAKAQEAFQNTLREATRRAGQGDPAPDRLWFFRDARWRAIIASESGLQAEPGTLEETDVASYSPAQIGQLQPEQLAIWISAAPEPQRSALAAFYLDEFTLSEMLILLELKAGELAELISSGRRQFQAWLDATTPHYDAMSMFRTSGSEKVLTCIAPITDKAGTDRRMRAAVLRAKRKGPAAVAFAHQQAFDRAMAALVRDIPVSAEISEWFRNEKLIPQKKRGWKKTITNPVVLSIALALAVIAGVVVFIVLERMNEFPGSGTARKMLTIAGSMRGVQMDPVEAEAGSLSDLVLPEIPARALQRAAGVCGPADLSLARFRRRRRPSRGADQRAGKTDAVFLVPGAAGSEGCETDGVFRLALRGARRLGGRRPGARGCLLHGRVTRAAKGFGTVSGAAQSRGGHARLTSLTHPRAASIFDAARQGSSVVEQGTHKPLVGSSTLPSGTFSNVHGLLRFPMDGLYLEDIKVGARFDSEAVRGNGSGHHRFRARVRCAAVSSRSRGGECERLRRPGRQRLAHGGDRDATFHDRTASVRRRRDRFGR